MHQTVVITPQRRRHLHVRLDAQSGVRTRLPRHLRRQTAHELLPVVDEERVLNGRGEQCGEGLTRGRKRICRCCIWSDGRSMLYGCTRYGRGSFYTSHLPPSPTFSLPISPITSPAATIISMTKFSAFPAMSSFWMQPST